MAYDVFLKIDTIPGESTDDKHKDWIEVLNYSWAVMQEVAGGRSTGGAASSGRVSAADFSFTKVLDKASPKLFSACVKGEHIKEVKLELCRATGDKTKYMEYKLSHVYITSITPLGSSKEGGELPLENVTCNVGKAELTYVETDHLTGKSKGNVTGGYDFTANKPV